MKIKIEITDSIAEDEIIIRCKKLDGRIADIQKTITDKLQNKTGLVFYKDKDEYYFPLANILFFETCNETVYAHTADDVFKTERRLYELQQLLPYGFVRISKSAIVNTVHILSISRNLTSSSLIKFHKSHKQIYVSRLYYKELKQHLNDERNV